MGEKLNWHCPSFNRQHN